MVSDMPYNLFFFPHQQCDTATDNECIKVYWLHWFNFSTGKFRITHSCYNNIIPTQFTLHCFVDLPY